VTLPSPNLDDRRFQQLVDDAKRLVQQRCPEWTDHNVSDPGVTLIEAFATMVDQLLYRLNRVPDKHYLAFLELIGVRRYPPTAATTDVTFRLSAPQPVPVPVAAGAEVATARSETDEAIVFSTTRALSIVACEVAHLATAPASGAAIDRADELAFGRDVPCFGSPPTPGDALCVGLSNPVPGCLVALRLACRVEGVGVDPRNPPLAWEAWTGGGWTGCEVERDDTGGLNRAGEVLLHVPDGHLTSMVAGRSGGWLRCRLVASAPGQPGYLTTPMVREVTGFTIGGTVPAVHGETVADEVLGMAEGVPGQRFWVSRPPVVAGSHTREAGGEPFVVEVAGDAGWSEWTLVEDFAGSGPQDRHVRLEPTAGEVAFGPAVRQPDGTVRYYGAVPAKGCAVRVRRYRTGGGQHGNVATGELRVLRSSLPYVAQVENRRPARGGVDGETVDNAKLRGPMTLRTLYRAVVPADYEQLAREAAPQTARVCCVPAAADDPTAVIRLLVVPAVPAGDGGRIRFEDLVPSEGTLRSISAYLDERRPIGARVLVQPPLYQGVTVVASIQVARGTAVERVRADALAALYRYFNPLNGGPDGRGWPFGRPVQAGEAFAVLQRVPGVDLVEEVRLYPADPLTGERREQAARVPLERHWLVFSYEHQIRVREEGG
jgi:predicted phage baseplate assembly protein